MTTALPKQIQEQVDEAERLEQELAAPPTPETPDLTPPAPPEVPASPAGPTPPPEPQQDAEYWRQRFKTLEGIQRAEAERRDRESQELRSQIQTLSQRPATPPAPPAPPAPLVTAHDEEQFGSDLISAMRRVAQEESRTVRGELQQLNESIKRFSPAAAKLDKVVQDVALTREGQFYNDVERQVSDWQQVNVDSRWLDWLKEYDPVAGATRQEALNFAQQNWDAPRIAAMFNLFKKTIAAPAPQAQFRAELARQVAPSKSSTVSTPTPSASRFTAKQYQYWVDPRRVHDTDKTKLAQMLNEMERAEMEGRIDFPG